MDVRTFAINEAKAFLKDLELIGIKPKRALLFGSYAKNVSNKYSDIDLAIWAKEFVGIKMLDYEIIGSVLGKHTSIEAHTFSIDANTNDEPMIEEIEKNSVSVL